MVGMVAALTICRVILVSGFIDRDDVDDLEARLAGLMIAFWPVIMIIGMAPRCA